MNAPVFGPDGRVVLIAHCVEEITDRVSKFMHGLMDSNARERYESAETTAASMTAGTHNRRAPGAKS